MKKNEVLTKINKKSFKVIFMDPDLMLKKYLNSIWIAVELTKYDFFREKYVSKNIEICYWFDKNINENYKEIIYNLKQRLFENTSISVKIHSYKDKVYLIVPQSYFKIKGK